MNETHIKSKVMSDLEDFFIHFRVLRPSGRTVVSFVKIDRGMENRESGQNQGSLRNTLPTE